MRRIKQIEEYKGMISDAFIRLLQKHPMEDISISQITKHAGIGRNTFYNHFQKKEDILDYLMQGFVAELQAKLQEKEKPSVEDFLLWRFTLLKENPLLAVVQNRDDIKSILYGIRNSKVSLFDFPPHQDIYKLEFFQGGIDYVTSKWIINGMKESPEEMAGSVLSYMNR